MNVNQVVAGSKSDSRYVFDGLIPSKIYRYHSDRAGSRRHYSVNEAVANKYYGVRIKEENR